MIRKPKQGEKMVLFKLTLGTLLLTVSTNAALRGARDHEMVRHLQNDDVCPTPLEWDYYNAYFDLIDKNGNVCAACSSDDAVIIGTHIQDVVTMVDEKYPDWSDEIIESIETTVCAVPWSGLGSRRDLLADESQHRKLGSYTYRSGGRCRRCKSRRRRDLGEFNGRKLGEFADAACDMASVAEFALAMCESAVTECNELLEDIATETDKLEKEDERKKFIEDSEKICAQIPGLKQEAEARNADAASACDNAKDYADNGKDDDEKKMMKEAEEASKKAMEKATAAQNKFNNAKELLRDIKFKIISAEFGTRENKLKQLLDDAKKEYEAEMQEMQEQIKILEAQFKEAKSTMDEIDIIQQEADLKKMMVRAKRKEAALEKDLKDWQENQQDEADFMESMARHSAIMETATSHEEYMNSYIEVLQEEIPRYLFRVYKLHGNGDSTGCLDKSYQDELTVEVTIESEDTEADTLIATCDETQS